MVCIFIVTYMILNWLLTQQLSDLLDHKYVGTCKNIIEFLSYRDILSKVIRTCGMGIDIIYMQWSLNVYSLQHAYQYNLHLQTTINNCKIFLKHLVSCRIYVPESEHNILKDKIVPCNNKKYSIFDYKFKRKDNLMNTLVFSI